ncbi:uncharacterized protein LOC107273558 isoform X2 [Cephus cinctus]|uniref:Uncharacterized protein LOC107273558 isoform X2 n=1 Tax=Cephus cinctus TaxID=211228 RepID=A0AAJ7RUT5_CEPCN|nr:uncharacterized protein LOC107273558 isoform X2 [Cephus cinctus]
MVINRRIGDSTIVETPKFKVKLKKPLMETSQSFSPISNGRRVKFGSVAAVGGHRNGTGPTIPTAQPTTHQVRRILEEHADWQDRSSCQRVLRSTSSSPYVVSNYSIVASRGELARNSFAVCETPAPTSTVKKKAPFANGRTYKEEGSRNSLQFPAKETKKSQNSISSLPASRQPTDVERDASRSTRNSRTDRPVVPIGKSASVPCNLKEGLQSREKPLHKVNEDGILRRSSAFLASLTHYTIRQNPESKARINGYLDKEKLRKSVLANGGVEDYLFFERSPSFQTLPTSWKKPSNFGVKKSVSFSSDTSFEEKRSPYRKTAVHEAKVYRKGVLQDRATCGEASRAVPSTWESSSGGPKALLRAAREADEEIFKSIVARAEIFGFGDMDINAVDNSGRTAVSYMAGNGAIAMLETALSFPGLDPNIPDNEGNTPLHFAAQAGQIECLNVLLQRCPGIEVDARNILGFTPLMKAALQGRTKCAKILLFAGANPTLRDHGRGLRAEQWARFCGRYVCAEVIERFARHRLLERTTSCRWGSEPELAAKVLQGKVTPIPMNVPPPSTGLRSKIRRVFRTTSGPDRSFSLVSQLTSAALCASSPALPKPGDVPPVVKSLLRPLSVPQLRVTLVAPAEIIERATDKYGTNFTEKIVSEKMDSSIVKPPRTKKKNK